VNIWDLARLDPTSSAVPEPLVSIGLLDSYPTGTINPANFFLGLADDNRFVCLVFTDKLSARYSFEGRDGIFQLVTFSRTPSPNVKVVTLGSAVYNRNYEGLRRIPGTQCALTWTKGESMALLHLNEQAPAKVWDMTLVGDRGRIGTVRLLDTIDGRVRICIAFQTGALVLCSFELPRQQQQVQHAPDSSS